MAVGLERDFFPEGEGRGDLLGLFAKRLGFLRAVDAAEAECFACAIDQRGRLQALVRPPLVPCRLLVGHAGTCGASQRNHLGPTEAHLATPPEKVSGSEVERVAELDQHVE